MYAFQATGQEINLTTVDDSSIHLLVLALERVALSNWREKAERGSLPGDTLHLSPDPNGCHHPLTELGMF